MPATGASRSLKARELRRFARWLVAVNLIVGAMLGLTVFHSLRTSRQIHEARARTATENLVEGLKAGIWAKLNRVDGALLSTGFRLKHIGSRGPLDLAFVKQVLAEQKSLVPEIESLWITDALGNVQPGAGVPPFQTVNLGDREYFRRVRDEAADALVVSEPTHARISKKWVLVLARRLSNLDGSFAGIVYANVAVEEFHDLFKSLSVGRQGAVTLRTESLRLVARYTPGDNGGPPPVGSANVSPELAASLKVSPAQGFFVSRTKLDNIERTNSYRRVHPFPLYVLAGLATAEFFSQWRADAAVQVALASVLMLVLLGASCGVYRSRVRQYRAQQEVSRLVDEQGLMLNNELIGILRLKAGQIMWANKAIETMFGHPLQDLVGYTTRVLCGDDEAYDRLGKAAYTHLASGSPFRAQLLLRKKNGSPIWVDASGALMADRAGESLWVMLDVTQTRLQQQEIERAALYDSLTGLPNRRLLHERLELCLHGRRRSEHLLAVAFMDLDGFKPINDTHGHETGDVVLCTVARRMQAGMRAGDTIARIGGDEFVLIFADLKGQEDCMSTLERILAVIREPIPVLGKSPCAVSASIGVAFLDEEHATACTLLATADVAMYRAKKAGGNQVCCGEAEACVV
ncbi:bifunctional diguanylate cyclase/phosphodiesterase [Azohydromonas lata]|uniref:Diguanylate cyclase n=1 Tax=Azohydromonas lata TaxID=45677 RepID=A0ABU5I9N2_9BURK|nr:diguanylate cyclase [Azohydromonas lata]MDZ5455815.1 diguanylate cyclase [Azohydromonas lata]